MTDSISKSLSLSFSAHIGLLALLFLKMTFFPSEPIQIRKAMRVDIVALPDKAPSQPAATPQAPPKMEVAPPKPQVKTPPQTKKVDTKKVDTKKMERSQESAMSRLKAMEALEKIKAETEAKPVKGTEISKGNSLTGLEQIEYDRYFDQVEKLLYSNWALPEWLVHMDLRAQALVLVDENGNVTKKEILKSSGNPTFDDQMMTAIEKSSPFPAPPARLQGVLANQGFVFNFPN